MSTQRSAALDAGRLFEAAVQDIDYAFKYGYPKELQFKVGMAKGVCGMTFRPEHVHVQRWPKKCFLSCVNLPCS